MIRVEALTRRYGYLKAVDQVSFEIGTGEIVGLLGHNGAGKTTIMKMLTGYLEPTGGSIEMGGRDPGSPGRDGWGCAPHRGRARSGPGVSGSLGIERLRLLGPGLVSA